MTARPAGWRILPPLAFDPFPLSLPPSRTSHRLTLDPGCGRAKMGLRTPKKRTEEWEKAEGMKGHGSTERIQHNKIK